MLKKNINARIRLYSGVSTYSEVIFKVIIPRNQILIINDLHQKLLDEEIYNKSENKLKIKKNIDYGICQIETEDTNLQANLYVARYEKQKLKSIAVDHFTGG